MINIKTNPIHYFLNYLRPNSYVDNINMINIEQIKKQGFKVIMCDLDNTLVPHFTKMPTNDCITFRKKIKEAEILFIIVSNNSYKRVSSFSQYIKADDFIYNAKKPLTRKITKMMQKYKIKPKDLLFIGDQFIFDIFVANRIGCKSILTLPLIGYNEKHTMLNFVEKYIYKKLEHNNLMNNLRSDKDDIYEYL